MKKHFKNVCYFDQVAMVTIRGLLLAKHGRPIERNSKTKGRMTMKIYVHIGLKT